MIKIIKDDLLKGFTFLIDNCRTNMAMITFYLVLMQTRKFVQYLYNYLFTPQVSAPTCLLLVSFPVVEIAHINVNKTNIKKQKQKKL